MPGRSSRVPIPMACGLEPVRGSGTGAAVCPAVLARGTVWGRGRAVGVRRSWVCSVLGWGLPAALAGLRQTLPLGDLISELHGWDRAGDGSAWALGTIFHPPGSLQAQHPASLRMPPRPWLLPRLPYPPKGKPWGRSLAGQGRVEPLGPCNPSPCGVIATLHPWGQDPCPAPCRLLAGSCLGSGVPPGLPTHPGHKLSQQRGHSGAGTPAPPECSLPKPP